MKISKTQIILIAILLLSLILRLIAINHVDIEADELVISTRAINFISAERLSTPDQEPLFHYLTDLGYKLLGVNAFSTRFPPLIASLLSILLIFYIAQEFFNKKIALLSAFFLSINHFFIRFMIEPDIVACFFALFSTLLFIKWIKTKKSYLLYLSALMLSLGLLNKPTIIMIGVAFAYLFAYALVKKQIKLNWSLIGKVSIAFLIILICMTPIFAYNYLLFKEKGVTDILFTRFFKMNKEPYQGLSGIDDHFSLETVPLMTWNKIKSYLRYDPFIFPLTLLGFAIFLLNRKKRHIFSLIWIIFPFIFIAGSSSVSVHYAIIFPFFCLLAADAFYFICSRVKSKLKLNLFYPLLFIVLVGTLMALAPTLRENSSTIQLREFAKEIPENAFVLVDSRTYRGIIAYSFNDKHYLETNHWLQMQKEIEQLAEINPQPMKMYIIECVTDKCGWSDVSGINETNEMLFDYLRKGSSKIKTIEGNKYTYDIYKRTISMNPDLLIISDLTHSFYYFPVGYKNKHQIFDHYETKTVFDKTFNSLAYLIIYIETFLAVLSAIALLVYFIKKK